MDCRWYTCIVHHCFAGMAVVSLPIGDAKEKFRRGRENKLIFE